MAITKFKAGVVVRLKSGGPGMTCSGRDNTFRSGEVHCQWLAGKKMDWREDFDYSLLNEEALNFLIEYKLGEKAAGITKRVISHGLGSLSEKQMYIFKTDVVDAWLMRKCKCGNHEVEGHELIGLWENDGYCSRCAERMDKDN